MAAVGIPNEPHRAPSHRMAASPVAQCAPVHRCTTATKSHRADRCSCCPAAAPPRSTRRSTLRTERLHRLPRSSAPTCVASIDSSTASTICLSQRARSQPPQLTAHLTPRPTMCSSQLMRDRSRARIGMACASSLCARLLIQPGCVSAGCMFVRTPAVHKHAAWQQQR